MNRIGMCLAVVAIASAGACGLAPDAVPRDLPEDERNIAEAQNVIGTEAEGLDRIYLATPGDERLLRSVSRDALSRNDLIDILLAGPNDDEAEQQISTFLPRTLDVLSIRKQGPLLFVDVSPEITELTGQTLSFALAQIVFTATELDGVERVQITVEGRTVAWPTGGGDDTTEPLSRYDFPGFVQSAQPPFPAVPTGA